MELNREYDTIRNDSDHALRPDTFGTFLGQENSKQNLKVCINGALSRGETLDHILISGPPGLGKTTLANIIATEMNSRLISINAPGIKTKGELASILTSLNRGDILFIDEIHGLTPKTEEILYSAMEDFQLEVIVGNQALTIKLEPFTLIGATTRAGLLQRPLRDRFGLAVEMQPYSIEELSSIIMISSQKLGILCDKNGAIEIANRSNGTPRIANKITKRVRDYAQAAQMNFIDKNIVEYTCERLGIDNVGLDKTSQRYLKILVNKSIPIAVKTITSILGESLDVVEEVIEPILLRLGFIEITSKGRIATSTGCSHLHIMN